MLNALLMWVKRCIDLTGVRDAYNWFNTYNWFNVYSWPYSFTKRRDFWNRNWSGFVSGPSSTAFCDTDWRLLRGGLVLAGRTAVVIGTRRRAARVLHTHAVRIDRLTILKRNTALNIRLCRGHSGCWNVFRHL